MFLSVFAYAGIRSCFVMQSEILILRSKYGFTSKVRGYRSIISRCCPVTHTSVSKSSGYFWNSFTSGHILMVCGRVPRTSIIFFIIVYIVIYFIFYYESSSCLRLRIISGRLYYLFTIILAICYIISSTALNRPAFFEIASTGQTVLLLRLNCIPLAPGGLCSHTAASGTDTYTAPASWTSGQAKESPLCLLFSYTLHFIRLYKPQCPYCPRCME